MCDEQDEQDVQDVRGDDWHWTDEEREWGFAPDETQWPVEVVGVEGVRCWEVWKGLQEKSERLYRSPTGWYFLGSIDDEPPYDCGCGVEEECFRGRVWPGCEPGDTFEFRRHMAAHWCDDQGHEMPADLQDVTREQIQAIQEEIDKRFAAAWFGEEEAPTGGTEE